jgi:mannose-6-phosphate isomerase
MPMSQLYPLLVAPQFDERIWGGHTLAAKFGKDAPRDKPIGESWEVYDENRVVNGIYCGLTIAQLRAEMGGDLMGHVHADRQFPLLTKLIDAQQALSVQVHPDDQAARRLEHQPNGKTECWYIVDVAPGAELTYGFKRDTSPQEYEDLVGAGKLEEILRSLPVKPGDVVYIPAGTVHAIGAGIVLYEVQQTSDITYRIYDWNRRDASGKARELHVEKARQVLDYHRWSRGPVARLPQRGGRTPLVAAEYFSMEMVEASAAGDIPTLESPVALLALDEPVDVLVHRADPLVLHPYCSAVIPAGAKTYRVEAQGGNPRPARAIAASVPRSQDHTLLSLLDRGYDSGRVERFLAQFAPARDLGVAAAPTSR